ncbi:MAG: hypothetical protein ABIG96_03375 [Candidatus Micrarchaeota archaeon]
MEEKKPEKRAYLGVYCNVPTEKVRNMKLPDSLNFQFRIAGKKEDLPETAFQPPFNEIHSLINKIRIPAHYAEELLDVLGHTNIPYVGHIYFEKWDRDPETAESKLYNPRVNLPGKKASGLPFLMEILAVKHLRKFGYRFVKTSAGAEAPRLKQVSRVGLEPDTQTRIALWLKGMDRGIRETAELYRRKKRLG